MQQSGVRRKPYLMPSPEVQGILCLGCFEVVPTYATDIVARGRAGLVGRQAGGGVKDLHTFNEGP